MSKFEEGRTYTTRSLCDYAVVYSITILKRTEKTITTSEGKVFRIKLNGNVETVKPLGSYSMAPTIMAEGF